MPTQFFSVFISKLDIDMGKRITLPSKMIIYCVEVISARALIYKNFVEMMHFHAVS